jgi:hypothetical protein
LSDDDEAAIRWESIRSSCATDGMTPNSGVLSIIFAGSSTPSSSGIHCELRTSLALPANTYLRSLTIRALGALVVEPQGSLSSMVAVHRECDDGVALVEIGRNHDWTAPSEPGTGPEGALPLDLDVGGTALMEDAGDSMCDGRRHTVKLVASMQITARAGGGSTSTLDTVDLLADVASCAGPRFESLCEWADNVYRQVVGTDKVEPPTLDVVDDLAYGLTPSGPGPRDRSCRDDVAVVREAAEQRLESRRDALVPLLRQRCSEPMLNAEHDPETMAAVKERQCRARQALEFLGESTQSCACRSGGADAAVASA